MNVRNTKKPEPRIQQDYLRRFDLQAYGYDNLYPQHLMAITAASGTATLCLNRYAKFIEGFGFSEAVSGIVVNRHGETMDDVLSLAAEDVARFRGFALHVNYNVLGEVSEVQHVPFEQCRLEETDDAAIFQRYTNVHDIWQYLCLKNHVRQDKGSKILLFIDENP